MTPSQILKRIFILFFAAVIVFSAFSLSALTVKAQDRQTSGNYTCDVYGGTNAVLNNCTGPGGTAVKDVSDFCVTYQSGGSNKLNCETKTLMFKDGSTANIWDGDNNCFYLKSSSGSNVCVPDSDLNKACGTTTVTVFGTVRCDGDSGAQNFTEFKNKLGNDYKNTVGNTSDVKAIAPSQLDANCIKDMKAGDTKTCNGFAVTKAADGTLSAKDGTKYDALGAKTQNSDPAKASDNGNPLAELGKLLMNVLATVLLLFVWFVGWMLQGVLWLIGSIFLIFVRINPAGEGFIQVAIEPWKLIVSIANLATLASFVYLGFSHILGTGKKMAIDEFITKVVIVTVLLNFSIFGAATVVNVFQGIGDVFVGGYAAASQKTVQDALIGSLIDGVKRVSVVRCGNLNEINVQPGTVQDCKETDIGGQGGRIVSQVFNTTMGGSVSALFAEVAFCVIIGYAIWAFWRGMTMALFRIVALWLLMVTSPLALAGYFSPIKALKDLADKWVKYFMEYALFYPVFVIGLIMVGILSATFGNAARTQITSLQQGGLSASGVVVNAAGSQGDLGSLVASLLVVVLAALVPVAALTLLLNFMKNTFAGAVGMIWGGIKTALAGAGSIVRGGGALAAAAVGTPGKLRDFGSTLPFSKRNRLINEASKLPEGSELRAAKLEEAERLKSQAAARQDQRRKRQAQVRGVFNAAGGVLEFAPVLIEEAAKAPRNFAKVLDKNRKARAARFVDGVQGNLEYAMRRSGAADLLRDTTGYDIEADPNLQRFANMNKETLKSAESQDKNYAKNILNASQQSAFSRELGIQGRKIRQDAALNYFDYILNQQLPEDINQWSASVRENFKNLVRQSSDDPALANRIFSSPKGGKWAQQVFSQLDPDAQQKLSRNYPQITSPDSQRQRGRELVGDTLELQKLDRSAFTKDFVEGYIEGGGDLKDIVGKINNNTYSTASTTEAQRVYGNLYKNGVVKTSFDHPEPGELNQARSAVSQEGRMIVENDLLREIGNFKTSDRYASMTQAERTAAIQEMYNTAVAKEYGVEESAYKLSSEALLQRYNAMSLEDLEKTNVSQLATRSVENYSDLSPEQKKELLARTNAEAFTARSIAVEVDKQRHDKITDRYASGLQKQQQVNAVASAYGDVMAQIQRSTNPEADLNDERVQQVFGAREWERAIKNAAKNGTPVRGTFLPEGYFSGMSSIQRQEESLSIVQALGQLSSKDPAAVERAKQTILAKAPSGVEIDSIIGNLKTKGAEEVADFRRGVKQTDGKMDIASMKEQAAKQVEKAKAELKDNSKAVFEEMSKLDATAYSQLVNEQSKVVETGFKASSTMRDSAPKVEKSTILGSDAQPRYNVTVNGETKNYTRTELINQAKNLGIDVNSLN